jgi:uncharacterized membrane protein YfcA
MPQGFPPWLWAILSVVAPIVYQLVLAKLPGLVKYAITWGLTAAIVAFVGFVILHYSPGEFLAAFVWVVASMQAIYSLFVKPAAKRIDTSKVKL